MFGWGWLAGWAGQPPHIDTVLINWPAVFFSRGNEPATVRTGQSNTSTDGSASAQLHFGLTTRESVESRSLYAPPPPPRARKTVELGYKTAASAFSFGSSASIKVSGLLLLRVGPLVLGISCCRSLDPSRHFLLLMRRGKTGRHGRARADKEEVR